MALLSSPVSSLINGVSQQPASLRFPSQVQAQENSYSSITSGLNKRHPSQHVAGPLVDANGITGAFTHTINRDAANRYSIIAYRDGNGDANIKAFDLTSGDVVNIKKNTGTAETPVWVDVTPADLGYINTSNMSQDLRAITVVDHTWLLNSTKSPTMLADAVSTTRKKEALIVVWKFGYGQKYTIRVEDKVFQWRTTQSDLGGMANTTEEEARISTFNQRWVAEQLFVELGGISDTSTVGLGTVVSQVIHPPANTGDSINDPAGTGGDFDATTNNNGKGLNGGGDDTGAGTHSDWVIKQTGPMIHIYRNSGEDFDISVVDGEDTEAMTVIKGETQVLADMPNTAPHGMKVKIVGDEEEGVKDDYFVEFNVPQVATDNQSYQAERQIGAAPTDTEAFAKGVWQESISDGIPNEIDAATMPHKLIDQGSFFEFTSASWSNKLVGDATSNPNPSFIDDVFSVYIKDIFFFKNRLGFIADDNIIMSETGEYDNFFRTTIVQLLDSDPIDVGIAHPSVAKPNHAIPFQDSLVLFTDTSQFHLSGDETLSPKTTTIEYSTEFENSSLVRPVPTGRSIFFAQRRAAFSGVREYYQVIKDELYDALDVTAHVPTYIQGDITHMAGSTHDNILVINADGEDDAIYIYKYLVGKDEKLQSAWSRYTLAGSKILDIQWIDTDLYIVAQRTKGSTLEVEVFIEKMTIEPGITDTDETGTSIGFVCNLDRRLTEVETSPTHSSGATTFTLPYERRSSDTCTIMVRKEFTLDGNIYPVGSQLAITNQGINSNTLTVNGNFTGVKVFVGIQYDMSVTLSIPYIKPQPGSPIYATGRFQLMYGHMLYHDTDYFRVEVTPTHRTTRTTEFNSGFLGASVILGSRPSQSGQLKFPIYARNDQAEIKIINDTPMSTSIMGVEYEGQFNPRSSRIG